MTQCTADSGVTTGDDGKPVAIRCEREAAYLVTHNGVARALCAPHASTFTRNRPGAERRAVGSTPAEAGPTRERD